MRPAPKIPSEPTSCRRCLAIVRTASSSRGYAATSDRRNASADAVMPTPMSVRTMP
jgi:hypothetical protein